MRVTVGLSCNRGRITNVTKYVERNSRLIESIIYTSTVIAQGTLGASESVGAKARIHNNLRSEQARFPNHRKRHQKEMNGQTEDGAHTGALINGHVEDHLQY
jgi:hypothetical protein